MTDLPLTIKEHPRARNVLVKLVPGRGLEVVVPRGFDRSQVPEVLQRKQQWIKRTRARMEADGIKLSPTLELPESLEFRAVGTTVPVDYLHKQARARVTQNASRILVGGDLKDREAIIAVLKKYVTAQARLHLLPLLQEVSQQTGLEYAALRVRTQKTRWGSCSARGTISLNSKALFLPPKLVRHLLIHELCHTKHMNHSPAYWAFVASFEPDYARLEKELQNGNRYVPGWLFT